MSDQLRKQKHTSETRMTATYKALRKCVENSYPVSFAAAILEDPEHMSETDVKFDILSPVIRRLITSTTGIPVQI